MSNALRWRYTKYDNGFDELDLLYFWAVLLNYVSQR